MAGKGDVSRLKPLNTLPPEEARAIRRKGASAACLAVKKKKGIKAIYEELLTLDAPKGSFDAGELAEQAQTIAKERKVGLTNYEAMALAVLAQAMQGDVKAATFVRDSAGDKPQDAVQLAAQVTPGDVALVRKLAKTMGIDPDF